MINKQNYIRMIIIYNMNDDYIWMLIIYDIWMININKW